MASFYRRLQNVPGENFMDKKSMVNSDFMREEDEETDL